MPALRRPEPRTCGPFEDSIRRIVGAEQLRLRVGRGPASRLRTDGPTTILLDVPGDAARPMQLEAVCVPSRRFDD